MKALAHTSHTITAKEFTSILTGIIIGALALIWGASVLNVTKLEWVMLIVILVGVFMALLQMRGHEKGLFVLFFTEMWERFSYYGMRAILIFYLTKHFLFDRDTAYGIYGAYVSFVYLTPVIGGVLADKYLGYRKAIALGAVLLVLGHLGMAIEGEPVTDPNSRDQFVMNIFYLSLALIIAGVGFLKANISAIVGELYPKVDPRRDSGFTLFYVGINLGAALGAIVSARLGESLGWNWGFGAAGIGMLFGLLMFTLGKSWLHGAGEPPDPMALKKRFAGFSQEWLIYLCTLAGVLVIWQLVRSQEIVNGILILFGLITLIYILYICFTRLNSREFQRIIAAVFLISLNVLFWALFEQAGSSLNIYTDEHVDRNVLGETVPAATFQSLNAMYIVFLGPIFAWCWAWLAQRGKDPSTPLKFGLGVIQLGLGYLVFVWGAGNGVNLTPVLFIFLIYLLHTTGELCLSPVGLSAMTRLSPPIMVGLIMGAWFLASAGGNAVSALIAQATVGSGEIATGDKTQVLDVYWTYGVVTVLIGIGLVLISPFIKRLMHLDTLGEDMAKWEKTQKDVAATTHYDDMAGERMSPGGDPDET